VPKVSDVSEMLEPLGYCTVSDARKKTPEKCSHITVILLSVLSELGETRMKKNKEIKERERKVAIFKIKPRFGKLSCAKQAHSFHSKFFDSFKFVFSGKNF
jgi:hypothetical protein